MDIYLWKSKCLDRIVTCRHYFLILCEKKNVSLQQNKYHSVIWKVSGISSVQIWGLQKASYQLNLKKVHQDTVPDDFSMQVSNEELQQVNSHFSFKSIQIFFKFVGTFSWPSQGFVLKPLTYLEHRQDLPPLFPHPLPHKKEKADLKDLTSAEAILTWNTFTVYNQHNYSIYSHLNC